MRLLLVWMWESFENLPLLFGFVIAARHWEDNLPAGLAALVVGIGLGVLVTHFVEPKLHKGNREVRWISTLVNFILFIVLAVPFIYYFRVDTRWINWKTDLLAGLAAGLLLTFIQSLHWTGKKSRMLLHGAAMLVAFPVIMLGLRYIVCADNWGTSLLFTFFLTLFTSLVIALIDYREMYRHNMQS
jgi:hypothetical protein